MRHRCLRDGGVCLCHVVALAAEQERERLEGRTAFVRQYENNSIATGSGLAGKCCV